MSTCRTKGCIRAISHHGLWCGHHYTVYKAHVRSGETTWEVLEKGRKRASGGIVPTSNTVVSEAKGHKGSKSANGASRGYSLGVLPCDAIMPFPDIHSCLWKWPNGRVLNYGFNVPDSYWAEKLEPSEVKESAAQDHKATTDLFRYCPECQRWAAHIECRICGTKTVESGERGR